MSTSTGRLERLDAWIAAHAPRLLRDPLRYLLLGAGLNLFRLALGTSAATAGLVTVVLDCLEEPLALSLLVLGVALVAHLALDFVWWRLPGPPEPPGTQTAGESADESAGGLHTGLGYREAAALYVTTPGVVLGLLTVFGEDELTTTLKVGSAALAGVILLALVLFGWVVYPLPRHPGQLAMLGYVFNLMLSLLAFGVLTISLSIVYR